MKALSMAAAARKLGIAAETLKELTDAGKIPCWFKTDSGRYVYSEATLDEHQRLAARRAS